MVDISHASASDGLNINGGGFTGATWTAENPAAITQVGDNLRFVVGQTTKWIELSYTASSASITELVSVGDGWAFDFENYGGGFTPTTTNYNVTFNVIDGV